MSSDPRRKVCVEGTQSVGQFVGGRGDGGGQTLSSCVLATLRLPLGAVFRLMGKGFFSEIQGIQVHHHPVSQGLFSARL